MKTPGLLALITYMAFCFSCSNTSTNAEKPILFELSTSKKQQLASRIDKIAEQDGQYRSIISLGTLDQEHLKKDKELRQTASLEEYIAFTKTIEKTLGKEQIDSLWKLQHELDYQNYKSFKEIIEEYGYPSSERLTTTEDKLFPILLHPPIELEPAVYLQGNESITASGSIGKANESRVFRAFCG